MTSLLWAFTLNAEGHPGGAVKGKRKFKLIFLAFAFLLLSPFVHSAPMKAEDAPESEEVKWQNIGPGGGGWVQSLAFDPQDPDILYLGCDVGGFYISFDGGKHFQIRNKGLHDYFVECIAVNPHDPKIILLGTQGGIFRTTDRGKSWRWIEEGFPLPQRYSYSHPIGAIAFAPQDPRIVYAGIGRPRLARKGGNGQGEGAIYKSEDGGITWRRVDGGQLPSDAVISDIEVKPDDVNTVLVATNKGIFRSDDGGKTWKPSSEGLPHLFAQELAFSPSQPNRVYSTLLTTSRGNEGWNGGVYRSDDGGRTWRNITSNLPQNVGHSLYEQSNYGEIVVDPRDPDVIYVGGRSWWNPGIYKTKDGGESWEWVTVNKEGKWLNVDYGWIDFWGPAVECLAISPLKPERLAFGTSGHLFLSNDGGRSWKQRYCEVLPNGRFRGNGLEVTCLHNIVADPVRPNRLYLCYFDIGLLISEDGGRTFWRSFKGMKGEGNCFTVLVDPESPNTIWAGTGQWAWNEGYICKSEDGGKSWKVAEGVPNGQVKCMLLDPNSKVGKRRLLATVNGYGFYESLDGGESWHSINGDLPEEASKSPRGLLMDPKDPQHLIVACGGTPERGGGIYESKNGGMHWERINEEGISADIYYLTASSDFKVLYLATREFYDRSSGRLYPGGLFRSDDGGRKRVQVLDYHFVSTIALHPKNPNLLYVGTTDHPYHDDCVAEGVLKSTDGGKTWRKVNEGLSHWNISALAINPHNPSILFAGTGGNGAFIGRDDER